MPSVRYFTWLLTSTISYIGLYTKQTQIIQPKAKDLRTVAFEPGSFDITANRAIMNENCHPFMKLITRKLIRHKKLSKDHTLNVMFWGIHDST